MVLLDQHDRHAAPLAEQRDHLGDLQAGPELPAREAEVLLWIAQGRSNHDAAANPGCSPRTMNKRLEQIHGKPGVDNRTAAATIALKRRTGGAASGGRGSQPACA